MERHASNLYRRRRQFAATLATGALAVLGLTARAARAQDRDARTTVVAGPTGAVTVVVHALEPDHRATGVRFAATDAYVDAAPAAAERSVPVLAAYLARSGPDDMTRARAMYRWVTRHIDYDANGLRTSSFGDVSPEAVLRRRATICEGYARLSEALGAAMGLQVEVVKGWSKGYGYTSGQRMVGPVNHAWNAVKIDGQWRLMDPTWGAGYLDPRGQFVRQFQEHYFLTGPDAFVFDHLPEDPRWQLLARPISAGEYADLVYPGPMFFLAGFRTVSHPHVRIAAEDRLTVTLAMTQRMEMMAQLVDPASDRPLQGEFAFVQASDTQAEVRAAFPRAGDYVLRVFAKPRGSAGALEWVLDYRVHASRGTGDAAFPMAYSGFAEKGAWLLESFGGALTTGRSYRFRVRAPGATELVLVAGGRRTTLTRNGDEFSVTASALFGENVLYGKYDSGSSMVGLLKYTAR